MYLTPSFIIMCICFGLLLYWRIDKHDRKNKENLRKAYVVATPIMFTKENL